MLIIQYFKKSKAITAGAIIVIIVLAGVAYRVIEKSGQQDELTELAPKVKLLDLSQYSNKNAVISAVGTVESLEQVDLKSQLSGQVRKVNVKIGQRVKRGDLLVELEHAASDAQLSQAAAAVERAGSSLDLRVAGASEQEIERAAKAVEQADAALKQAEASLRQAEESGKTLVKNAEIGLRNAKANLDNSGASLDQASISARENLVTALKSSNSTLLTALTESGNILGKEPGNPGANDSYENVLGVKNSGIKAQAESAFASARSAYEANKTANGALSDQSSEFSISSSLDACYRALEASAGALKLARETLDNTITKTGFDNNALSGLKSAIDFQIASVNGLKSSIQQKEQARTASSLSGEGGRDALLIAYEKAEQDHERAIKQAEANTDTAKAAVAIQRAGLNQARASYGVLTSSPRDVDLSPLNASLKEAQSAYRLVAANRDKAFIRAPFDGEIAAVPVKAFDLANPGQTLVALVNNKGLQIKAYLNENDISLIGEGSAATIADKASGAVSRISPSLDPQTRKVEVVIAVSEEKPGILIGQSVNITIRIKEELLDGEKFFLPLKAVEVTTEGDFVYLLGEGGQTERRQVVIGQVLNEAVEITGGLEGADKILESVRGIKPGQVVEIKQ